MKKLSFGFSVLFFVLACTGIAHATTIDTTVTTFTLSSETTPLKANMPVTNVELKNSAITSTTTFSTSTVPLRPPAADVSKNSGAMCTSIFNANSVSVSLATGQVAVPGEDFIVTGTLTNGSSLPLSGLGLYVKIVRNGTTQGSYFPQTIVDSFYAKEGLYLAPGSSSKMTITWKVPLHLQGGDYTMIPLLTQNGRLVYPDNKVPLVNKGIMAFSVRSSESKGVFVDQTKISLNGRDLASSGMLGIVTQAEPPVIKARVQNTTPASQEVVVRWKLYKWDSLKSQNLLVSSTTALKIAANGSADTVFLAPYGESSRYEVTAQVSYQNVTSMASISYAQEGVTDVHFGPVGVGSLLQNSQNSGNQGASAFSCFTAANSGDTTKVKLEVLDDNAGTLFEAAQPVGRGVGLFQKPIALVTPPASYRIRATAYVGDKVKDVTEVPFDCTVTGVSCTSDTASAVSLLPFIALLVALAVIIIAALLIMKKRMKLSSAGKGAAALILVFGAALSCAPRAAYAACTANQLFCGATGKHMDSSSSVGVLYPPGYNWRDPSDRSVPPAYPFSSMIPAQLSSGVYDNPASFPYFNVTVTQHPSAYVAVNGAWGRLDQGAGKNLAVGDQLWITAGFTQDSELEMSGSYASLSTFSSLGKWMDDNTLYDTMTNNIANFVYNSNYQIYSSPVCVNSSNTWVPCGPGTITVGNTTAQALLRARPRSRTISVSGPAVNPGRDCRLQNTASGFGNYDILICTVTAAGPLNITVTHGATTGDVTYGRVNPVFVPNLKFIPYITNTFNPYKTVSSITNTLPTPERYMFSLPAASINFNFSAGPVNQAPQSPTIACPAGNVNSLTNVNFSFTSTDPDGDAVAYEVNWDGSTIEPPALRIPTNPGSYDPSGTTETVAHQFATAGSYTVKALAIDSTGQKSGWASCPVTVVARPNTPPTPPLITIGQGTCTNPITPGYHSFLSTDPESDTLRYGVDTDMNGTVDYWIPANGAGNRPQYVASGICGEMSLNGVNRLQAFAEDSLGARSGWTQWQRINTPPNAPVIVDFGGPFHLNTRSYFSVQGSDPDDNWIFYQTDGNVDGTGDSALPSTGVKSNNSALYLPITFALRGRYMFGVRTADVAFTSGTAGSSFTPNPVNGMYNSYSLASPWAFHSVDVTNRAPNGPLIAYNPANEYRAGGVQSFAFQATDNDNDKVRFLINWGDGSAVDTTGYFDSGTLSSYISHTYASVGTYDVTVTTQDNFTSTLANDSNLKSAPKTFRLGITGVLSVSGGCGGTCNFAASCQVTDSNPEAYSLVTWSVSPPTEAGAPLALSGTPMTYAWSSVASDPAMRPTSFSGANTAVSSYFKTLGVHTGPKVRVDDISGRYLKLFTPNNPSPNNCPNVIVKKRPLYSAVFTGKRSTAATIHEITVNVGETAGIKIDVGKGMGIVRCNAEDSLASDRNAPNVNPNKEFDRGDPDFIVSFTTSVFTTVGDRAYTLSCTDDLGAAPKQTATVHVIKKPDFSEF